MLPVNHRGLLRLLQDKQLQTVTKLAQLSGRNVPNLALHLVLNGGSCPLFVAGQFTRCVANGGDARIFGRSGWMAVSDQREPYDTDVDGAR